MQTRRIVWTGPGQVALQDGSLADPGAGEVLLETEYSLVSPGTEREWLHDDTSHAVLGVTFPFTPGYSSVGTILAIGSDVKDWAVGDRVVPLGAPFGAHAAHQIVPAVTLFKVPENVSSEQAVMYQLGGTAVHTIRLAELADGASIGIVGQGPIGQIALQAVRALHPNSPTLALDLEPNRVAIALRLGASIALDPREEGPLNDALASLGGGVRVAVDLSGSGAGVNAAITIAGGLARVVLSTGMDADLSMPYGQIFGKGLTLVGAFVGARPMEFGADTGTFLSLLSERRVTVGHLTDAAFSPDQAPQVYERVLAGDRELGAPLFAWK